MAVFSIARRGFSGLPSGGEAALATDPRALRADPARHALLPDPRDLLRRDKVKHRGEPGLGRRHPDAVGDRSADLRGACDRRGAAPPRGAARRCCSASWPMARAPARRCCSIGRRAGVLQPAAAAGGRHALRDPLSDPDAEPRPAARPSPTRLCRRSPRRRSSSRALRAIISSSMPAGGRSSGGRRCTMPNGSSAPASSGCIGPIWRLAIDRRR